MELPDPAGSGLPRRMTRIEWETLPLDQRIRAILSKRLRFFRGDEEVPVRDALGER